jgi:hypothetical protein
MNKSEEGTQMNQVKKKPIISVLMLLVLVFSLFLSEYYVISHVQHDCTGDDCPICIQIDRCLNTLQSLTHCSAAPPVISAALIFIFSALAIAKGFESLFVKTLVALRVRLDQ